MKTFLLTEEQYALVEKKLCARGKRAAKSRYTKYPCVPLNSQALTKQGWKTYYELKEGDIILTYNMEEDVLEWQPINYLHYYENAELLNFYKATGFHIKCTKDHKWVLTNKDKNSRKLVKTEDINKSSEIVTCAKLKTEKNLVLENFSKKDNWVEKVIQMSSDQREVFLASAIVYDGWDQGVSTRIEDRHTFGFKQKNDDHNDACLIAAYLSGYYVNESSIIKEDIKQSTIIRNKRYHNTQNLIIDKADNEDVWCPTTLNNTWVMKQNGFITITGNSAYANGHAVQVCKGKIAGLDGKKKKASGYTNESEEYVDVPITEIMESGGLDKWFDEKWVRISTSGNITGPCGTMKDQNNPSRCLPKAKAKSLTKAERAATAKKKKEKGKNKQFVSNTKKAKVKK